MANDPLAKFGVVLDLSRGCALGFCFSPGKDQEMKNLQRILVIAVILAVFACYRWSNKNNTFVLEQPIAVAISCRCPDVGHPASARSSEIANKFRCDEHVETLPDLLHHLGNGFSVQMPDHPDDITRGMLLTGLLDATLPTQYKPKTPWLFRGIDGRPHVSQGIDPGVEGHPSQLLAEFAALGIRSSRVVRSGPTSASIAELIRSLQEDFHLEGQIEWKAIALARYAPSKVGWVNRWGQAFDFDTIVVNLLRRVPTDGSCRGTHILQTLATIWHVDALKPILSESSRDAIRLRLATTIGQLRASQRPEGYWAPDWSASHPNRSDYQRDRLLFSEDQIALVTGHHLEWLDMVDDDFARPDAMQRAAIEWCVRSLERVTTQDVAKNFCAYSHCYRAMTRHSSPETWSGERRVQ